MEEEEGVVEQQMEQVLTEEASVKVQGREVVVLYVKEVVLMVDLEELGWVELVSTLMFSEEEEVEQCWVQQLCEFLLES